MFIPQVIIPLDDLSSALFRMAQFPRERETHLGVLIDDKIASRFASTPLGLLLSAQIAANTGAGDEEIFSTIYDYLDMPVCLRGMELSFEYYLQPYISHTLPVSNDAVDNDNEQANWIISEMAKVSDVSTKLWPLPEISLCELFDTLNYFLSYEHDRAEIVSVRVNHEGITEFLSTITGLTWLSQVIYDGEMYGLIHEYVRGLEDKWRARQCEHCYES